MTIQAAKKVLLTVRVDQELCTGDAQCMEIAPDIFELDDDECVAYVKGPDGELLREPGAFVEVPSDLDADVMDAVEECQGRCIYVTLPDGKVIGGPDD